MTASYRQNTQPAKDTLEHLNDVCRSRLQDDRHPIDTCLRDSDNHPAQRQSAYN